MFTVSKLAKHCGLSRSTLLYYERIGLLKPTGRSDANYRRYGGKDLQRLERICVYRDAGLKLADIRAVLDRPESGAASVLKRRLVELNAEIDTLRNHQRAILRLLNNNLSFERTKVVTKEKWVSVMKASGFSEAEMRRWHIEFEHSAPEEHQEFLEFLRIPEAEIRSIREWSRKGGE
jgi:MerR family transcriptional regulator, thiopeptide resistance regulator